MPRIARLVADSGFFHVFNRGLAKQDIFKENADYRRFLTKLKELKERDDYDFSLYAYVLMPNYFHFLIETKRTPLAKIMSSLLTSYSMYFNKKYARFGPLFQNRFKSKLCDKNTYFLGASRYVHLNPIEQGLVERVEDYPWSSYQELFAISSFQLIDQDKVKKFIGNRENYLGFLQEGIKIIKELPKQYVFHRQIEGSAKFQLESERKYLRTKIRRKIDNWFKIRLGR